MFRVQETEGNVVVGDSADRPGLSSAYNMFSYLAHFDLVLLLQIDDETRERRLVEPTRAHEVARDPLHRNDIGAHRSRMRRPRSSAALGTRRRDAQPPPRGVW